MSFGALDINLVRGAVLILLILAFAALWAWAWSRNRKEVFREVSMLPLEEDFAQVPPNDSKTERTKE
jgi:cbb3-type cytochrome oxidase subunit 3